MRRIPYYWSLSDKEKEVLYWISYGLTYKEVAKQMTLSVETIKHHVTMIYLKLEAKNKAHAVRIGFQLGLLTNEGKHDAS